MTREFNEEEKAAFESSNTAQDNSTEEAKQAKRYRFLRAAVMNSEGPEALALDVTAGLGKEETTTEEMDSTIDEAIKLAGFTG